MIDDSLFIQENGKTVFASTKNNQLWVPLIEKAFAKVLGSYCRMDASYKKNSFTPQNDTAAHILTGAPAKRYSLEKHRTDSELRESFWEEIKNVDQQDFILSVGSNHEKADKVSGIVQGHAFSLLGVNEVFY